MWSDRLEHGRGNIRVLILSRNAVFGVRGLPLCAPLVEHIGGDFDLQVLVLGGNFGHSIVIRVRLCENFTAGQFKVGGQHD